MKTLKNILQNTVIKAVKGSLDITIKSIEIDSRLVEKNTLFIAQKGLVFDGHKFINKAIEKGAVAIICEEFPSEINTEITYIKVTNTKCLFAALATNFYNNPSSKLKLIGITGTNGKTTIATLLYNLFTKAGYKTGLLSTVKIMVGDKAYQTTHTTPDSFTINKYLAKMVKNEVTHCFMEVSSHGIHQNRIEGLTFTGGLYTNLTHDHLDYHNSFLEYRDIKKQFFDRLPKKAFALVNTDDKNGSVMLQNTSAKKYTYSLKSMTDFKAKILENNLSGLLLNINGTEVSTKLIGNFNAYNILAIYAIATLLEIPKEKTLLLLSKLENVAGRFQHYISNTKITAIVDYAHTPDALKNVLQTINFIKAKGNKIITVVGCGGNRDKSKRPIMGNIASMLSNQIIFTSDNPRNENPQTIIEEMEEGVRPEYTTKTLAVLDRNQAIKTAVKLAKPNDIILIAGKGHETHQEINGVKKYFNDFEVVTNYLKAIKK